MERARRPSLRRLAEATPATRDRYVDLLRAVSIAVVVLGHWTAAAIAHEGGRFSGRNALEVVPRGMAGDVGAPGDAGLLLRGGFSNLTALESALRRGGGYAGFLVGRVRRLMRPTAVFLAVWVPLAVGLDLLTGLGDDVLRPGTQLLTRPLWFLGIYMIVIAFAPAMARLRRRHGARVLAALAGGAGLVDAASAALGAPLLGYLNFALVWLFAHQLGFFYADGTLPRLPRRAHVAMALGGLAVLALLTSALGYSPSMVGLAGEQSNTNPPTVAIVALAVWEVGLAMLLRARASRWLARTRPWAAVIYANSIIMTAFLWHQTALFASAGALLPLGFPQPATGSAAWWVLRPVWLALLGAVLAGLVLAFGRFERGGRREEPAGGARRAAALLGTVYTLTGVLGFAVSGFHGFAASEGPRLVAFQVNPLQNVVHLVAGWVLLRAAVQPAPAALRWVRGGSAGLVALGAAGVWLAARGAPVNVLAADLPGSFLHVATGAALLVVGGFRRRAAGA